MTKFVPCIEPKLSSNYLEEVSMYHVHELNSVNIHKQSVALFVNDSNILQNLDFYLSLVGKCGVNPQNAHVYVESWYKDLRIRSLRRERFNVHQCWVPERQDIIWINFDPQSGREMQGWHPCSVLSPRWFNYKEGIVWGLPMTTKSYNASHPLAIAVSKAGNETSYVLCHRLRELDWLQRGAKPHHFGKLSDTLFDQINARLGQLKIFEDFTDDSSEDIQDRMMRDMLKKADSFDTAILVGGNDDFCHLIKQLQRKDKRVEVAGLNSTTSIALRNTADGFIDLEQLFFREAS
ncbi:MAG: type II toxin-antitoxin system PemK/MazF family toxin [Pseudanabaena sp. M57BS1SP1A06MG]|uniref:type II toxin-antitoxin system PemK/MazF family toxin n=1 Tax=Microcystis sp. M51BS1 TaxID=2771196 RepID=UPI00259034D4|nr:type II toxin-antitoxin system PemK/MazF family toxin [Microcystis sp. M51BS1]MCA6572729.1 type II toxin-antitoxin system PemK/MazF family toxin [Pseudanabaena sp. M53BS1SP1A06MG]MCA6584019.1 type II toxin-antitoxin system PemK/MazF family toxin [Pseudanabaena sp. M34BS1SP1A06MG]MCA6590792.1 type II toxin-antitoxin system PemK/MazF family toxin [Pseudanabaena sp. M38BS1SP1A06MG]MCA6601809.1 type II toxin-antitoxin system PemK/MazF family toxin [Pseudanabaena sp. M57BS1SP1A06MG]MCA2530639.1 